MMSSLSDMLYSPRILFRFAGFLANGWELQNNGWSFSAYENRSLTQYGTELQVMMRHEGGDLNMISTVHLLRIEDLFQRQSSELPFTICGIQVGNRTTFMHQPRQQDIEFNFSKMNFSAIDMTPNYERINLSEIDLNKFGVFKKLNDSANIFLPEKTVNELMDEILKKHEPVQKEIRKNRKRESVMQEFNRNPNENIKLQLVAV